MFFIDKSVNAARPFVDIYHNSVFRDSENLRIIIGFEEPVVVVEVIGVNVTEC